MNNKGLYPRAHSPLNRMKNTPWLADNPIREFDLTHSSNAHPPHARLLSILRRLAWLSLAATLLAGLLTWGFHSRFGLLLLLLLR
ncbi:hypothetical protein [Pseudomonas sp. LD120]|uniref:hypothetical protein n=1 Tax=Pseudomonas sp. LD120 TaxID=485751 RepID=UPI001357F57F|nr:hypothetical protein [Pseudomonas sp. LD120]KAF0865540.1 hypothetical protein PLD_09710 [Pseudomonas sp. LD120]